MYVTIKGSKSDIKEIKAEIPQVSVLGPIFYNIYINDIPRTDKTHLAIYIDNTAIYTIS